MVDLVIDRRLPKLLTGTFRARKSDIPVKVSDLLGKHPDLMEGFSTFLDVKILGL